MYAIYKYPCDSILEDGQEGKGYWEWRYQLGGNYNSLGEDKGLEEQWQ